MSKLADELIYYAYCILTLGAWWATRVLITKAIQIAKEADSEG